MGYFAEIDASSIVQRVVNAPSAAWCASNLGGDWVPAPDPAALGGQTYPPIGYKSHPTRSERFLISSWNSPDNRTPPNPSGGDDTTALQAWFDALPSNVVVNFPASQTYQVSSLTFDTKANWKINGNGCTFTWDTVGAESATFLMLDCDGIAIDNLTIDGENPDPGMNGGGALGYEGRHGVSVRTSTNVRLTNLTIRNVMADCVYIGVRSTGVAAFSEHVLVEDCTLELNGRMGVAIVAGLDITIRNCAFSQIRRSCLDLEPNSVIQVTDGVTFANNTLDAIRLYAIASGGYGGAVQNIYIDGNTTSATTALTVLFDPPFDGVSIRRGPIWYRNNTDTSPGTGSNGNPGQIVTFIECDGVYVTGNRIPAAVNDFMVAVRADDCTQVQVTNNTTPGADYLLYLDGRFINQDYWGQL